MNSKNNPAHAILSASGSKRWMACPGSVKYDKLMSDTTTTFAEEGTLAHEMAENKVKAMLIEMDAIKAVKICKALVLTLADVERVLAPYENKVEALEAKWANAKGTEMDKFTEVYKTYIQDILWELDESEPLVLVERKVTFDKWVPQGFGTADCIIASDKELHIVDLKYGKGVPVFAEDNTQLKIYALGAFQELEILGLADTVEQVTLHIVQPRIDNTTSYTIPTKELFRWGEEELKPKAQKAWAETPEFHPGSHCKFCKIKGQCIHRAYEGLNKLFSIIGGKNV